MQTMPELGSVLAQVLRTQSDSMAGRLLLSSGSWGNGRPFHQHGPALFALISGAKRWFVRRPNASLTWQTYEVSRTNLHEVAELPSGWASELWQCTQLPGDMVERRHS